MSVAYLACLVTVSAALVLLDSRFALVFWRVTRRATVVVIVGMAFFLAWDAVGIASGVFARGRSRFMTGIELAPELPVEEPVFLAFLCYLTLILIVGGRLVLDRMARRDRIARRDRSSLIDHQGRRR